jgi:hypothetical protein
VLQQQLLLLMLMVVLLDFTVLAAYDDPLSNGTLEVLCGVQRTRGSQAIHATANSKTKSCLYAVNCTVLCV